VQLRLHGLQRGQRHRAAAFGAQQVVPEIAELRLQRLFAEVLDFFFWDERVGHVFLLHLLAATIHGLDDGRPEQRVADQRLPQGLTQCPKRASA